MTKQQLIEKLASEVTTTGLDGKTLSRLWAKQHLPIIDWRNASKETPEKDGRYLVTRTDGLMAVEWWYDQLGFAAARNITHWAPITPDLLPAEGA